ncbi:MAG: hypothetical protein RI945_38, partial [Candidatus Parcubacteria bacterium]|jgi:TatD DNase family protein
MLDISKIKYIDIHSHLHFPDFDNDREEVIGRMRENGVATIVIGTDIKESQKSKDLSIANENIFYSVGLHPHEDEDITDFAFKNQERYFEELKELAQNERCLCVGECGLDYFYISKESNGEDLEKKKERQKILFRRHIELAKDLNIPLMLHVRPSEIDGNREDAYLEAIEVLKEYDIENLKVNFHFFVSTKNVLAKILENENFTVSIPAVCTFTNEYNEMIKAIPLERLHIETDSPYVVPKARRKEAKRNEPNFVIDVFEKICEIKEILDKEEFRNILKDNFKRMFLG